MKPTYIIIHHSLTSDNRIVSWQAIRKYHLSKGWGDIGYHFGIELINDEYEILLGRMIDETGVHTIGMNDKSIGICAVGNFDIETPNQRLLVKLSRLIEALVTQLNISKENIRGHYEYAPKTCPGVNMYPILKILREMDL